MTLEDWNNISPDIKFDYSKDNYFSELKDAEMVQNRISVLTAMQPYIGKYYSNEWVLKHVLMLTDDDIEEMREQIMEEQQDPLYNPPPPEMEQQGGDEQGGDDEVQALDTGAPDDPRGDKIKKIANAKAEYALLMRKDNKTMQDHAKLKSLSQIVAKNQ